MFPFLCSRVCNIHNPSILDFISEGFLILPLHDFVGDGQMLLYSVDAVKHYVYRMQAFRAV